MSQINHRDPYEVAQVHALIENAVNGRIHGLELSMGDAVSFRVASEVLCWFFLHDHPNHFSKLLTDLNQKLTQSSQRAASSVDTQEFRRIAEERLGRLPGNLLKSVMDGMITLDQAEAIIQQQANEDLGKLEPLEPGACLVCGAHHPERTPHDPTTRRFLLAIMARYGRPASWGDVIEECDEPAQGLIVAHLQRRGFWPTLAVLPDGLLEEIRALAEKGASRG